MNAPVDGRPPSVETGVSAIASAPAPLRRTQAGRYLFAAALPVLAIAVVSLVAAPTWIGDLCRHWSHLAALVLLIAIPCCWHMRRHRLALIAGVLAGAWPWIASASGERAVPTTAGTPVLTANLYDFNRRRPEVIAAVRATGAEVVALQEVTPADREALAAHWPHQVWPDDRELFASALFSRHPITRSQVHDLDGFACIEAEIGLPDGVLRVLVVHLRSPKKPDSWSRRDRQIQSLAGMVRRDAGPVLLLGDCNCTWSSPATAELRAAGLRAASGLRPATWPAWLGPLGTDLDHILARGLGLSALTPLSLPGSDHRGLRGVVRLHPR